MSDEQSTLHPGAGHNEEPAKAEALPARRLKLSFASPDVRIVIDEETIANSIRRTSSHCMIAEAIQKRYPAAKSVSVELATISWTDPAKRLRYTYLTPRSAQIGLIHFDRGEVPEPFSFRLRSASKVTRSVGKAKLAVGLPTSGSTPGANGSTEAERAYRRSNYAAKKARMPDPQFSLGVAPEVIDQVVRLTDDPYADLGPAVAIPSADVTGRTVIVGGHPPSKVGNLGKNRRFGLKAYLE